MKDILTALQLICVYSVFFYKRLLYCTHHSFYIKNFYTIHKDYVKTILTVNFPTKLTVHCYFVFLNPIQSTDPTTPTLSHKLK